MSASDHPAAPAEIWQRLDADRIDDDTALLVAAAFDAGELAEALAGAQIERPVPDRRESVEPQRAYLATIAVEGFRGIGPHAELTLKPAPGLTVVAGRNGSGKSSFAEAVEMLLTSENSRWADRPADWQSGWRNLHAAADRPTTIEARFAIDGQPGATPVRRWWDAGATAASASAAAVTRRPGEEGDALSTLGWNAALSTFRPFLPHSEVGTSVTASFSNLYDAMYAVLGLQDVAGAHQRLRQVRLDGDKSGKALREEYEALLEHAGHHSWVQEHTAPLFNAMCETPPDPDRIERAWHFVNKWPSAYGTHYDRAAPHFPTSDQVDGAIERIQAAERRVGELAGGNADRSARIAALLEQALDLHQHHGDQQDCPVCGARQLDPDWRGNAQRRLEIAQREAAESDDADEELRAALKDARDLIRPIPVHLADSVGAWGPSERKRQSEQMREELKKIEWEGVVEELKETAAQREDTATRPAGAEERAVKHPAHQPEGEPDNFERLQLAARNLGDAWEAWADLPDAPTPSQLVDHLKTAHPPLVGAAKKLDAYFSDPFWEIFPKLTENLPEWAGNQRTHNAQYARLEDVRRAENWLRRTLDEMRDERFDPISEHAVRIWNRLSGATNVELAPPKLAGAATSRKIKLEVLVDGASSDARGVMSQGELNSLALSLFLPRALLDESPFGFVVIDDPVQAMDPSKVDGLARVLADAAAERQVVVFTHDDRLPEAIRRLQIEADLIAVTRSENSVVQCRRISDPVSRYLDDARAISRTPGLPPEAARRSTALFLRLAIEAACTECIRSRRIGRGEPHAEVEALLERADSTTKLAALALFDDADRHGDVRSRIASSASGNTAEAYRLINAGAHTGNLAGFDPSRLLHETERIIAIIRAA